MRIVLFTIPFLFMGCINQKGVSIEYYDDCHIEYDMYGGYEKICPHNFYNLKKEKKKDCLQCN